MRGVGSPGEAMRAAQIARSLLRVVHRLLSIPIDSLRVLWPVAPVRSSAPESSTRAPHAKSPPSECVRLRSTAAELGMASERRAPAHTFHLA